MPPVLGNAIVIALLVTAVTLALRSLRKSRKSGGGCSCGCDGCPGHGLCHPEK